MSDAWKDRELARFTEGRYKPVPFATDPRLTVPPTDPRALHFPHISKDTPDLMAYTQNPEKGERDLKTKIKPGTYLKKFFGAVLSGPEIAKHAANFRLLSGGDGTTLHIATTPTECIEAYRANGGSCMSFQNGGYAGHEHPACVYGDPDPQFVTVAYLRRGGRITAKALLNRAKRQFQSGHGDTGALFALLEAQGYRHTPGCLNGLWLHAVPNTKAPHLKMPDGRIRFCAPAIDSHPYARHDATRGNLVLLSHAEFVTTPPAERVNLGLNGGLTA